MSIDTINATTAPKPIGPYSHAVKTGSFVFCSGQVGLIPETGEMIEGGVSEQTDRALANLGEVLKAAGADFSSVVKTTVFLADMGDFPAMNHVYEKYLGSTCPARSTIAVKTLPKDALVEIEAIAEIV